MSINIWFNDPSILLDKEYIGEIIPNSKWKENRNINALSRLIILLSIVFSIVMGRFSIFIIGLVSLALIYSYTVYIKKEGFETKSSQENDAKITWKNPLNNLLAGDGKEKKEAPAAYGENTLLINDAVKKMVNKVHPSFKNMDKKLFKDLGENFEFNRSMIQFNSAPNTTIPNDQGEFSEYLYGSMLSGKEGSKFKLMCKSNQLHYYNL